MPLSLTAPIRHLARKPLKALTALLLLSVLAGCGHNSAAIEQSPCVCNFHTLQKVEAHA